jgi:hypothetical protein
MSQTILDNLAFSIRFPKGGYEPNETTTWLSLLHQPVGEVKLPGCFVCVSMRYLYFGVRDHLYPDSTRPRTVVQTVPCSHRSKVHRPRDFAAQASNT